MFRNVTKTSVVATAAIAALIITINCKPCIKESRAMSRNIEPKLPGSCPTRLTAPPRLSSAASFTSGGMPAGIFLANSVRYIVVPMLPKTAMPRAPPSSPVVSEIAYAAAARSGTTTIIKNYCTWFNQVYLM